MLKHNSQWKSIRDQTLLVVFLEQNIKEEIIRKKNIGRILCIYSIYIVFEFYMFKIVCS
jgi:hypothetical protein